MVGFDCHPSDLASCPPMLASRSSDLVLCTTTLIISNEAIHDVMKIVKSLEE